jgi:hypothetical protein
VGAVVDEGALAVADIGKVTKSGDIVGVGFTAGFAALVGAADTDQTALRGAAIFSIFESLRARLS